MDTFEAVKSEWMGLRQKYSDLIADRIGKIDSEDFEAITHQNGTCTDYFPEEKELYKKIERLRNKLMHLKPEEFHFGTKCDSKSSHYNGRQFSSRGDIGFFFCSECSGLIKCEPKDLRGGLRGVNCFTKCEEHKTMKRAGTMTLNKEMVEWL